MTRYRQPAASRLARYVLAASLTALVALPVLASGVISLDQASEELGIRLLRPNAKVQAGHRYEATVRNPLPLARLGLEGLRPGDRVICRAMPENKLMVFSSDGDRTAPIQLAESGAIQQTEQVPRLNLHRQRELRQPRSSQSSDGAAGLSTFGRAGPGR